MGAYISSPERTHPSLVPSLSMKEAKEDYELQKRVIESREDIEEELKNCLLHSLTLEMKLREKEEQEQEVRRKWKKLQQTNQQLQSNASKAKQRMMRYKEKTRMLTIALGMVLGTALVFHLISQITSSTSSPSFLSAGTVSINPEKEFSSPYMMNEAARKMHTGYLYFLDDRAFRQAFTVASSSMQLPLAFDDHKQKEFQEELWKQLKKNSSSSVMLLVALKMSFKQLCRQLCSQSGGSLLLMTALVGSVSWRWRHLKPAHQMGISAAFTVAFLVSGLTMLHKGRGEVPHVAFLLSELGSASAAVAITSWLRPTQKADAAGQKWKSRLLYAAVVFVANVGLFGYWQARHPLVVVVLELSSISLLHWTVAACGASQKTQLLSVLLFAVGIVWNCALNGYLQRFGYPFGLVERVSVGVAVVVVGTLHSKVIRALNSCRVDDVHKLTSAVGVIFAVGLGSVYLGVQRWNTPCIFFGALTVAVTSILSLFVFPPSFLCLMHLVMALVSSALLEKTQIIASVEGNEWVKSIELAVGPIGLVGLTVVSVVPFYAWWDCVDASSTSRSAEQVLWVHGKEYTPSKAFQLSVVLAVLSLILHLSVAKNATAVCFFLLALHKGYIMYDMYFLVSVFFVCFGAWSASIAMDTE